VLGVRRHDHRAAGSDHALVSVHADRDRAGDDVPDLFLLVVMDVQRRGAVRDVPDPERHVLRVEERPRPPGQRAAVEHVLGADEHLGRSVA
jgi:hypothetical protein